MLGRRRPVLSWLSCVQKVWRQTATVGRPDAPAPLTRLIENRRRQRPRCHDYGCHVASRRTGVASPSGRVTQLSLPTLDRVSSSVVCCMAIKSWKDKKLSRCRDCAKCEPLCVAEVQSSTFPYPGSQDITIRVVFRVHLKHCPISRHMPTFINFRTTQSTNVTDGQTDRRQCL